MSDYIIVWDFFKSTLAGIYITILIIASVRYLLKAKEGDNRKESILMIGFACIYIGFLFEAFFTFPKFLLVPGKYVGHIYYMDANYLEVISYQIFDKLARLSYVIGFTIFIFSFEYNIQRTKYILTIIQGIFLSFIIFLPYDLDLFLFGRITFLYMSVVVLMVLFFLGRWSRLEFKAISSILFVAIVLNGIAIALMNPIVSFLVPLYVPHFFYIAGVLIGLLPTITDSKRFTHALRYWIILGTLTICIITIVLIYALSAGFPLNYVFANGFLLAITVYVFYDILKVIKLQISGKIISVSEEMTKDLLGMFTKPQRVTEEEVTISKEKKICLVCKGKILRFNSYICNCAALYCENCAQTLIDLENACWVCEYPFDESKPVRILERKRTEISDKGKKHKKPKK